MNSLTLKTAIMMKKNKSNEIEFLKQASKDLSHNFDVYNISTAIINRINSADIIGPHSINA